MRRREQRYLLDNPRDLCHVLRYFDLKETLYAVDTLYLDYPEGTWSVGKGHKKFRVRWYNDDPAQAFFEIKNRKGEVVAKRRRKTRTRDQWFGLNRVTHIQYARSEFSTPTGNLRVTVDTDVRCGDVALGKVVVEIKTIGDVDTSWIEGSLPQAERNFSKSKWALSLMTR